MQSSNEIYKGLATDDSYATIKRLLAKAIDDKLVTIEGKGKGTKYRISSAYELLSGVDLEAYFQLEQDERSIRDSFNLSLMPEVLSNISLFTSVEQAKLEALQAQFKDNVSHLSTSGYHKEMERLAIDLSWKSSQIEGNTYSLLCVR